MRRFPTLATRRWTRHALLAAAAVSLPLIAVAARCGPPDPQAIVQATETAGAATVIVDTQTAVVATPSSSPTVLVTAQPTGTGIVPVTPTPPVTPFPTVRPFPTASSDAEPMGLGGTIWVDGVPAAGTVVAMINGTQCGSAVSAAVRAPDSSSGAPFFVMSIASATERPGCGLPGAPVQLSIDGRPFDETVAWAPGLQSPRVFVVGAGFAEYFGRVDFGSAHPPVVSVSASVNGNDCGRLLSGDFSQFDVGRWYFTIVVQSAAALAGCGGVGDDVTLYLAVDGAPAAVIGVVKWIMSPPPVSLSVFDLSSSSVTPSATGAAAPAGPTP